MENFENCKIRIFCNIDIRYFGKNSPKMPTNNNNDVNQQTILIKKRFYILVIEFIRNSKHPKEDYGK